MVYDRKETAKRLKKRRKELNISVNELSQRIGKAPRYYRDIERGDCGMSVETLIGLSKCLALSLDYILFGDTQEGRESGSKVAYRLLNQYSAEKQKEAVVLLKTFLDLSDEEKSTQKL